MYKVIYKSSCIHMVQSGNVFILFDSGTVIINGYKYGAMSDVAI